MEVFGAHRAVEVPTGLLFMTYQKLPFVTQTNWPIGTSIYGVWKVRFWVGVESWRAASKVGRGRMGEADSSWIVGS